MKINNNLKYNVSKYLISTSDNKNKKWAQIILNGIDTNYEICKSTGNVRNRNTKQVLKEFIRGKYRSVTLSVNGCKYKYGCCRICIYKSSKGCPSKNLACKLFNCSEVYKRRTVISYKDLKTLKSAGEWLSHISTAQ
jgi:hypothetical protein